MEGRAKEPGGPHVPDRAKLADFVKVDNALRSIQIIQDDGRRHDGTGQSAAARLIDARHEQGTGGQGAEQALFRGRCGGGSFAARGHRVSLGC